MSRASCASIVSSQSLDRRGTTPHSGTNRTWSWSRLITSYRRDFSLTRIHGSVGDIKTPNIVFSIQNPHMSWPPCEAASGWRCRRRPGMCPSFVVYSFRVCLGSFRQSGLRSWRSLLCALVENASVHRLCGLRVGLWRVVAYSRVSDGCAGPNGLRRALACDRGGTTPWHLGCETRFWTSTAFIPIWCATFFHSCAGMARRKHGLVRGSRAAGPRGIAGLAGHALLPCPPP